MTDLTETVARLLALREGTTPGPWRIVGVLNPDEDGEPPYYEIWTNRARPIQAQIAETNSDANALLVRAAPEMLDCIDTLSSEIAALTARAEEAEAKLVRMLYAMSEASDPDFLFGAMDNVNEFGASVSDLSEAASRAIRAYIEYEATREIGGGND